MVTLTLTGGRRRMTTTMVMMAMKKPTANSSVHV